MRGRGRDDVCAPCMKPTFGPVGSDKLAGELLGPDLGGARVGNRQLPCGPGSGLDCPGGYDQRCQSDPVEAPTSIAGRLLLSKQAESRGWSEQDLETF